MQGWPNVYPNLCIVSFLFQTASAKNMLAAPGKVASFLHMGQPGGKLAQVWVLEEGRAERHSANLI